MKPYAPALVAGALSALLYVIVFTFGLGFLFLFLPTLPIFWLGLGKYSEQSWLACFTGAALLTWFSNPFSVVVVYLAGMALPAWYFSRESLKYGSRNGMVVWFPITVIFARLMAAGSFALLAATLYYHQAAAGGLPGLLAPKISAAFELFSKEIDQDTVAALETAASSLAFLVFAVSAWMWGACLYLHGWVVDREMTRQKISIRPDLSVQPFPPPNWTITLLILSAVASLVGGPSLAFWGKASLIMLLFPYFLLGLALAHEKSRKLEYRYLLLFFIYFVISLFLWPVFIVSGWGFVYHLKLLNKYLSGGGTSSRS